MKELRNIPKVDELLKEQEFAEFRSKLSSAKILEIVRKEIDNLREKILKGELENPARENLQKILIENSIKILKTESEGELKKLINATGIVIHTNLGRSPLSEKAAQKVYEVAVNYNNLEYGVIEGKRKNRLIYIEKLITDLTGAESALIVNNNAAAVFLTLNTLCLNKEVILSRGEIVEIGDSFRIFEIIKASGCLSVEVGATNKTKISDYENYLTENTAALLKVHTSNFKVLGYTEETTTKELVELGNKKNIPIIEDMGSGVLTDIGEYGFKHERSVQDALKEGADIVTFSGDKLLGGPQAGIIVGKKKYIEPMKKNQMLRCVRIDKMCLAALEVTFSQYLQKETIKEIPILKSIFSTKEEIFEKTEKLYNLLEDRNKDLKFEIKDCESQFGGGTMPLEKIESYGLFISSKKYSSKKIEEYLRSREIPIISTIRNDEVVLEVRTINEEDFNYIADILSVNF